MSEIAPIHSIQLDAPQIDNELLTLLLPQSLSLFQYFSTTSNFFSSSSSSSQRIFLLLQTLVFYLTLGRGHATPGMAALRLRLQRTNNLDNDKVLGKCHVWKFYLFSTLFPYLEQTYVRKEAEREVEETMTLTNNSSRREILARKRRRYLMKLFLQFVSVARILNYVAFLIQPSSSPPTLSMRMAGIKYCLDDSNKEEGGARHINYFYAQRRMLYAELIRSFLIMSPLSGLNILHDAFSQFVQRIKNFIPKSTTTSNENMEGCPICHSHPIMIPYKTAPCNHIFCYVCVRRAIMENSSFRCPSCGDKIISSSPLYS